MNGLAAAAFPNHDGFTLIGNAYPFDASTTGIPHHIHEYAGRGRQNFFGIMFNPSGLRIMLRDRMLGPGQALALIIIGYSANAGRS
jgi:hypothetical protein